MTEIRNFITENKITFQEGERNSSIVTLIGFAQFKGLDIEDLENALEEEITQDSFLSEEIDRLWDYCKSKNYKSFWLEEKAKLQYTFI